MSLLSPSVIEVRDLRHERGPLSLRAPHAAFARDSFHLVTGDEGSGHELLVRVLGLLEPPGAGEVLLEGVRVRELDDEARRKLRERRLGFIFVAPFLLPAFTVIENVAMPLFKVSDADPPEARRRAETLLEFAGADGLAATACAELSLLDQHRVSLARALVHEPAALLVEGLDGALAGEELRSFATLLRQAAPRFGIAVIAAASRSFAAEPGDRVIEVHAGAVSCRAEPLPHSGA